MWRALAISLLVPLYLPCVLLAHAAAPRRHLPLLFGTRSTLLRANPSTRRHVPGAIFGLSPRWSGTHHSRDYLQTLLQEVRGGGSVKEGVENNESEDEEDDKEDDEDEEEAEMEQNVAVPTQAGPTSASKQEKDPDDPNPLSSVISMEPVAVTVRTSLGNAVLDQSLELTVHRSRDVASLKQSISRQLPGRPPVSTIQLLQGGVVLKDDLMVDELVDDEDVDDDDEQPDDDASSGVRVVLQLDIVPPVDPKFIAQLGQRMEEMTVSELLDAFAMNEAAAFVNTQLLLEEEQQLGQKQDSGDNDTVEDAWANDTSVQHPKERVSSTRQIKEQATRIRMELDETILNSEQSQKVIQESRPPAFHLPNLQERQVRGQRVRQAAQGGVKTTLKRKIQRNLNINWPDTLRHFCLFLFFGWFGGRTPLSRAILLLGAPSVFLLQARAVKIWIRQFVYALADHPPSILLSLLPAPQQAILSLDVRDAMSTIYGDCAAENVLQQRESIEEGEEEVEGDESDDYDDDE